MPGSAVRERSCRRMLRVCDSPLDARTLRVELLAELKQLVPFDAYAWLLTDPETSVGSSPLAECPCLPELPRLIRLKYLTQVNRWTQLQSSVACLADATGGDLSQSLVWRELLHRYEIIDVASVVFRDAYGCWGFLDLWRGSMSRRFTSAEVAYLADIADPVTAALRGSQARTFRDERHRTAPAAVRSCWCCRPISTWSRKPPRRRPTYACLFRQMRTAHRFRPAPTTSLRNCWRRRPASISTRRGLGCIWPTGGG